MRSGPRRPGGRRPPSTLAAALARDWAWELRTAGLLQLTGRELELLLRSQAEALVRALYAEPFVPDPARDVGAFLVGLEATGPDALHRTFLLFAGRLLEDTSLPPQSGRHRLDQLLGEFIAGWAEAVHAHTLAAQEELRRALDIARRGPGHDPPGDPSNPWFS